MGLKIYSPHPPPSTVTEPEAMLRIFILRVQFDSLLAKILRSGDRLTRPPLFLYKHGEKFTNFLLETQRKFRGFIYLQKENLITN